MREDIIKEALRKKAEEIEPNDRITYKIYKGIEKKEAFKMKKFKTAACVCAAVVVLTSAAIGAGKIAGTSSTSDRRQAITHLPSESELMDAVGYAPKFAEELGGYKFISAQPTDVNDKDEDGNITNTYKEISFTYRTEDGILDLHTHLGERDMAGGETVDLDGIEGHFDSFTYKSVPPDYVPTAEEKAAEEAGTLQIGYGDAEPAEQQTNFMSWYEDGITYSIMDMGCGYTKADMEEMAKEIINAK